MDVKNLLCYTVSYDDRYIADHEKLKTEIEAYKPGKFKGVHANSSSANFSSLSVTNLFIAPYHMVSALYDLIKSSLISDKEGIKEASLKLTSSSLAFVQAIETFTLTIATTLTGMAIYTLSKLAFYLGLIICSIEGCFSFLRLKNQLKFDQELLFSHFEWIDDNKISSLTEEQLKQTFTSFKTKVKNNKEQITQFFGSEFYNNLRETLDKLLTSLPTDKSRTVSDYIQLQNRVAAEFSYKDLTLLYSHYLQNQEEKEYKRLTNRLELWQAQELEEELPLIIKQLKSEDEPTFLLGVDKGKQLLNSIRIQSSKKKIFDALTITAVALAALSLVSFLFCPPFVFISLTISAFLFSGATSIISKGMFPNKGWTFTPLTLIPQWIRSLFSYCFSSEPPPLNPQALKA